MDNDTMMHSVSITFDDLSGGMQLDEAWPEASSCWSIKSTLDLQAFPKIEHFDHLPAGNMLMKIDHTSMNTESQADSHLDLWTDGSLSDSSDTAGEIDDEARADEFVEYAASECWQPAVVIDCEHGMSTHVSDQLCQAVREESVTHCDVQSKAPSLALQVKPRIRRRKFGQGDKHSLGGRPMHVVDDELLTPIVVTPEALRAFFDKPLHEAARSLGICATAVKRICRKMGIKEWPFQRIKPIRKRLAKLQSSTMTPDVLREIREMQSQELALLEGRDLMCFIVR